MDPDLQHLVVAVLAAFAVAKLATAMSRTHVWWAAGPLAMAISVLAMVDPYDVWSEIWVLTLPIAVTLFIWGGRLLEAGVRNRHRDAHPLPAEVAMAETVRFTVEPSPRWWRNSVLVMGGSVLFAISGSGIAAVGTLTIGGFGLLAGFALFIIDGHRHGRALRAVPNIPKALATISDDHPTSNKDSAAPTS